MVGKIHVMEPQDYQKWLVGGDRPRAAPSPRARSSSSRRRATPATAPTARPARPILDGVFGKPVALVDGRTVLADESYVRESILSPATKVVQGYQPIMPTFKDQISEEEIVQLIRYIKDLKPAGASAAAPAAAAPAAGGKS